MVRPDRVLGLTFTRKAAAEFGDRVRSRLERLRRAGTELPGHKSAGHSRYRGTRSAGTGDRHLPRLRGPAGQRQRPARGPRAVQRLITPALSWQLAAQIVTAYDGAMDEITWTPQTVTAAVLDLAGDLAEHLRDTSDVTAVGLWLTAEQDALPGG